MQRRAVLLFVLLVALVVFYSAASRQVMPEIEAEQKAQTEMLNNLDERVTRPTAQSP